MSEPPENTLKDFNLKNTLQNQLRQKPRRKDLWRETPQDKRLEAEADQLLAGISEVAENKKKPGKARQALPTSVNPKEQALLPQGIGKATVTVVGMRAMLEGGLPESHKAPTDYELKRIVRYACVILGWTIEKISLSLRVPAKEITKIVVRNDYLALRQRIDERAFMRAVRKREEGIETVVALGTDIMVQGLRKFQQDPSSLEIKDIKFVSDITANSHRISQLMKNKPTTIREEQNKKMSRDEIRAGLKELIEEMSKDPMFDLPSFLSEHNLRPEDVN